VSAVASGQQANPNYRITSPEGTEIKIPKELFEVLCDFLSGHSNSGTVIIQFRNGGVAGLESMVKRRHK
jgi:hypothetical protein